MQARGYTLLSLHIWRKFCHGLHSKTHPSLNSEFRRAAKSIWPWDLQRNSSALLMLRLRNRRPAIPVHCSDMPESGLMCGQINVSDSSPPMAGSSRSETEASLATRVFTAVLR
jgi:hypothetical protein